MAETDGCISTDVRCKECGYFLRGLDPDGRCPECGTAVQASLVGKDLHLASLRWLREIRRGFRLLKLSLAGTLLAIVTGVVVGALPTLVQSTLPSWAATGLTVALGIVVAAAAATALAGFVLATRAEPLVTAEGEGLSARRAARILGGLALLLRLVLWGIVEVGPKNAVVDVIVVVLPLCWMAAAMAAVLAFARHMKGLLARTPEEKTLKAAREVVSLAGIALVLLAASTIGQAVSVQFEKTAPEVADKAGGFSTAARGCNSCCAPIVVLGLLSLVWQVGSALQRTLAKAEASVRELESPPLSGVE